MTEGKADGIAIMVFGGVLAVAGIGWSLGGPAQWFAVLGALIAIAGFARTR